MPPFMISYQWREELSASLGKVKRPVAEVYIGDRNNVWRAITMLIDSGADISIIARSFGELFGHNVKKGKKIKLKGVGEEQITAYAHNMKLLIGRREMSASVAIAENDKVPNVLGRKDIFNIFEIHFKNLKECTRFISKS